MLSPCSASQSQNRFPTPGRLCILFCSGKSHTQFSVTDFLLFLLFTNLFLAPTFYYGTSPGVSQAGVELLTQRYYAHYGTAHERVPRGRTVERFYPPLEHALEHEGVHKPAYTIELLHILIAHGADPFQSSPSGRNAIDIARSSQHDEMRMWGRTFRQYLGRYEITEIVHISASTTVLFGTDMKKPNTPQVALKLVSKRTVFEKELTMRARGTSAGLDTNFVVGTIAHHMPAGQEFEVRSGAGIREQEDEDTTRVPSEEEDTEPYRAWRSNYPYVLIMSRGARSLHEVCQKEHVVARLGLPLKPCFSSIRKNRNSTCRGHNNKKRRVCVA